MDNNYKIAGSYKLEVEPFLCLIFVDDSGKLLMWYGNFLKSYLECLDEMYEFVLCLPIKKIV